MSDKIIKKLGWCGSGAALTDIQASIDHVLKTENGDKISFNGRIKWDDEDSDPVADMQKVLDMSPTMAIDTELLGRDIAAVVGPLFHITTESLENLRAAIAVCAGSVLDFQAAIIQLSQCQMKVGRMPRHDVMWGDLVLADPIDKNKPGKSYDKFVPTPWSHKRK